MPESGSGSAGMRIRNTASCHCFRCVQRVTLSNRTAIESLLAELQDLEEGGSTAGSLGTQARPEENQLFKQMTAVGQTPTKLLDASASELA